MADFLYTFFYHDVVMKYESHLIGIWRRMKELQKDLTAIDA
jgi:hypothetical protein